MNQGCGIRLLSREAGQKRTTSKNVFASSSGQPRLEVRFELFQVKSIAAHRSENHFGSVALTQLTQLRTAGHRVIGKLSCRNYGA